MLLSLLGAVSGCGGSGSAPPTASGSCADTVTWGGEEYVGSGVRFPARPGASLEPAERIACGEAAARVPVVRIEGVEPREAIAGAETPLHLYVAERLLQQDAPLSDRLATILLGPRCALAAPFTLAGALVGSSNLDQPHSVTVDVDETDGAGRRYLGQLLDVVVTAATAGLRERADFYPFASVSAETRRLRLRVRCAQAERPNETFVAEQIEPAAPKPPAPDPDRVPRLCALDETEPPCGPGAELGISYPYNVYTHCGVEYAVFDGRLWLLDPPLTDGSGNPPPGWDNPFQHGLMRLLADDLAEFRTAELSVRFAPAPADYERPGCE